ncbi:hypothetical protein [Sorangium sp. So ce406]|uniref:hypothetical protein n=1 Tax=Sorangium sp. So ce406 TaxID=3133311 RepID=UPI003F5B9E5D
MLRSFLLLASAAFLSACASEIILDTAGVGTTASGSGGAGGSLDGSDGAGGAPAPRVPVVLASGPTEPTSMAVDATHIYWTAGDEVLKLPLDGGSPIALASGFYPGKGIALDADHVYWIALYDAVLKVPKSGGPAVVVASLSTGAQNVAVDDQSVYMGEWGSEEVDGFAKIVKAPKTGGALSDVAQAKNSVDVVATDASSVYWINRGRWNLIYKVSKAGGSPVELFDAGEADTGAYRILTSDTDVIWLNKQGVNKGSKDGGAPVFLHLAGQARDIALDSANVYWTAWGSCIMTSPLTGGEPIVIAEEQPGPQTIAVDASSVYWINYDGTVMKAPR